MASVKKTKYRTAIVFEAESELGLHAFSNTILNRILPEYDRLSQFKLTTFEVEELDYPEIEVKD